MIEKKKNPQEKVIELLCNEPHEVKLYSLMSFQDMIPWVLQGK